jgi:glycosyltransferase involved in cell wall biosynthesis
MSTTNPTVTIGIPVYNGQNYLEQAVDSVLAQSYTDFEVVITDNASTDRTREICENYAQQDSRVRYFRSAENKGATWNFNRAFELSRGKYFKWLAHDDMVAPDYLAKCVAHLDEDSGVVVSYSRVRMIDGAGDLIEDYGISLNLNSPDAKERFREIILEWHLCFEIFGLIRSSALRKTPLLGNYGHADGVLLARLALQGRMFEVPEILFFSRRHDEQSMAVYGRKGGGNDYHSYVEWFDPSNAFRIVYPQWRILYEYYKSLWQYPLKWQVRLWGHFYILWWIRQNIRLLVKDLYIGFRANAARMQKRNQPA